MGCAFSSVKVFIQVINKSTDRELGRFNVKELDIGGDSFLDFSS